MYCIDLGNSKALCDHCREILEKVAAVFSVYCFTQKPRICYMIIFLYTRNTLYVLLSYYPTKHSQPTAVPESWKKFKTETCTAFLCRDKRQSLAIMAPVQNLWNQCTLESQQHSYVYNISSLCHFWCCDCELQIVNCQLLFTFVQFVSWVVDSR